jgi:hypothetical protein
MCVLSRRVDAIPAALRSTVQPLMRRALHGDAVQIDRLQGDEVRVSIMLKGEVLVVFGPQPLKPNWTFTIDNLDVAVMCDIEPVG